MTSSAITLINFFGTGLAAMWLGFLYVRRRHVFVKPSMLMLAYTHVLFQWPLALAGSEIFVRLPDPLALSVLVHGYMLLGLAFASWTWDRDARIVWDRIDAPAAAAARPVRIALILGVVTAVLVGICLPYTSIGGPRITELLSPADSHIASRTSALEAVLGQIPRYAFSLMTSATAPLLIGLALSQALRVEGTQRRRWFVATAGLTLLLGLVAFVTAEPSPVLYLAIVLLATFIWHRKLKVGASAWPGIAAAMTLACALMISMRYGAPEPFELVGSHWRKLPEILLDAFAAPFEVGTWYVYYAQAIGPIGVAAFPKLASALGVTAVDVPSLIGVTYADTQSILGVGSSLPSSGASTGHLLSYYGYMGMAALPVSLAGLALVDAAVKLYARLDESVLLPCVATVTCQALLFLQSDYTVTWVTHGLGLTLLLCFVFGRRLPAAAAAAAPVAANCEDLASPKMRSIGTQRIAHVSTVHPTFDVRIFHKECRSLALAGFDVSLIVRHDQTAQVDGVTIRPLPQPANRVVRMLLMGFRAFRECIVSRAQVFHLHDPELAPIGVLLKLAGKTVIYDAHEDLPRQIMSKHWISPGIRRAISWTSEIVEDFCARRFDAIVAATPVIGARFQRLNPNTIVVNNYPLESEMPTVVPWAQRERAVCYVGGIAPERGIGEIVQAIEGLDVELHLAGPVSPPDYLQQLEKLPGWSKVRFHGFVDRQEVYRLLCLSRVGLVCLRAEPNYLDSQPIKLYEYWSAGIPVVASEFPRWKQLIESNDAGMCVDPARPEEIARAIRQLIDDDATACRMGRNGRRLVESTLNWTHEERRLIDLYRKLVRARGN